MTPADVLAAAADKLDARLKHTTPGPWEVFGDGDRRLTIVGGADREYGVVEDYELNPDDAHYLAVMNPIAGKALVPVLRAFSEAYVRETRHFHEMWNEAARERMIGDKFPGFTETLALARLIIGGETDS